MSAAITPIRAVQRHITDHIDAAVLRHERTLITRHGRPAAVLLAFEELRALEEHRQQLADTADTAGLRAALRRPQPERRHPSRPGPQTRTRRRRL